MAAQWAAIEQLCWGQSWDLLAQVYGPPLAHCAVRPARRCKNAITALREVASTDVVENSVFQSV